MSGPTKTGTGASQAGTLGQRTDAQDAIAGRARVVRRKTGAHETRDREPANPPQRVATAISGVAHGIGTYWHENPSLTEGMIESVKIEIAFPEAVPSDDDLTLLRVASENLGLQLAPRAAADPERTKAATFRHDGVAVTVRLTYELRQFPNDASSGTIGSVPVPNERPTTVADAKTPERLVPPSAAWAGVAVLLARTESTSPSERLLAVRLLAGERVESDTLRDAATARLTVLLLDRSPEVASAAWATLETWAVADSDLAVRLSHLANCKAGWRTTASGSEQERQTALLGELESLRDHLHRGVAPEREQFQLLLQKMAGLSFGASNRQVVLLVNSICELTGTEFVDPADRTTRAVLLYVPSALGNGSFVLRKKNEQGRPENLSNRTRFPDTPVIREKVAAEDKSE